MKFEKVEGMEKKYALITGGSRGIGRAVAERLAQDGYIVIINYKSNEQAAQEVLKTITDAGGQGELLPFDVSDPKAIQAALQQWEEQHQGEHIDVLVNNAGLRKDELMVFMEEASWNIVMDTNMQAFYQLTHHVLQRMVRARHGRIINMSSVSGLIGLAGQVNYSAAKGALIGATKALSKEVAARNITVNAVAPGFIKTDMTADLDEEELAKTIPAKRFGTPQEVANLVSFLVSDQADYITGQVICVAGGMV